MIDSKLATLDAELKGAWATKYANELTAPIAEREKLGKRRAHLARLGLVPGAHAQVTS